MNLKDFDSTFLSPRYNKNIKVKYENVHFQREPVFKAKSVYIFVIVYGRLKHSKWGQRLQQSLKFV
jgi:hypothetical protein